MTTPAGDGRKRPEAQLLVVEDEPSLALTLGDRLLKERYEVETRADGESADVTGASGVTKVLV